MHSSLASLSPSWLPGWASLLKLESFARHALEKEILSQSSPYDDVVAHVDRRRSSLGAGGRLHAAPQQGCTAPPAAACVASLGWLRLIPPCPQLLLPRLQSAFPAAATARCWACWRRCLSWTSWRDSGLDVHQRSVRFDVGDVADLLITTSASVTADCGARSGGHRGARALRWRCRRCRDNRCLIRYCR